MWKIQVANLRRDFEDLVPIAKEILRRHCDPFNASSEELMLQHAEVRPFWNPIAMLTGEFGRFAITSEQFAPGLAFQ